MSVMKSSKPADDLLFENLTLGGKPSYNMCPGKGGRSRRRLLELKIGQNLASLVVTLRDYISTGETSVVSALRKNQSR